MKIQNFNAMKKLIKTIFFTILMAIGQVGMSQSVTCGVYMTFEDYLNGEMEYAINCSEESHRIRPHGTWKGDKFIVVHRGEKFTHDRSEIFGYKGCDGKDWRVYGKDDYQVAESRSIIIYIKYEEEIDFDAGPIPPTYHFSVNNGNILRLTKMNLKKAFPDDHDLHDKLDETFIGEDLTSYDKYHKMYKVNRVLTITGN